MSTTTSKAEALKYPRQDYLDGRCTHREYYGQFVTPSVKQAVRAWFTLATLVAAKDQHLNDIPLIRWDRLAQAMKGELAINDGYADGKRYWSVGSSVCILKEAARQLIDEAKGVQAK